MRHRSNRPGQQIWAGALTGALAAFVVGLTAQWLLSRQAGPGGQSTGAPQGLDLWSYFSMARAIWRSPNGITYCYPYQLYWTTPPIAFQLPITVLAWIGRLTGLPTAFEIARVAGGAGSGAAIGAIGALFPRGFLRRWFYIAAVFGCGLFGLAAIKLALDTAGLDGLTEPYQYEKLAEGRLFWWLPYLAANLRMPLEAVYHALVIGSLACLVWRRHRTALALGAAAWMSNPFTAIALHGAVLPWYLWRAVETSGRARRRHLGYFFAWLAVNLIAAAYYGWFLNRWPLFRDLQLQYRLLYIPALEWGRLLLLTMPYGLALLASGVFPDFRRAIWRRPVWRLFGILSILHLLLLQQSAFLGTSSMQAFHYDRGYLHLGLTVVSWRLLTVLLHRHRAWPGGAAWTWFSWRLASGRKRLAAIAISITVGITSLDQLFFLLYSVTTPQSGGIVSTDYAAAVRAIPDSPSPAIVLTEPASLRASYVSAFSPHVAYNAEETMIVPFPEWRRELLRRAFAGESGGVAALRINYVILSRDNSPWLTSLTHQGWTTLAEAGQLLLMTAPASISVSPAGSFSEVK